MSFWSELVREHYPSVAIFDSDRSITITEMQRFVRIILTEGIPFAFADCPMAYEFGRQRAAEMIGVHPKQVSMTGSARIGYSLAHPKFGRAYDPSISDVDLFLVDHNTYEATVAEYLHFLKQVDAGELKPRHEGEASNWADARKTVPNNIKKGFIDQKYIPLFDRFPMSQKLGGAGVKFLKNVNSVLGKEIVKRAPFRVYRDWKAVIDQISFSLMSTLKKRIAAGPAAKG